MNEANFGESKNVERDSKKGTRNKYLRNTLLTYIGISSSVTFAEHQLGYSEEVTRPLKRRFVRESESLRALTYVPLANLQLENTPFVRIGTSFQTGFSGLTLTHS